MVVLINCKTDWFGKSNEFRKELWPVNINLGLLGLGSELKKTGIELIIRDELCDIVSDDEINSANTFVISVDFNSVKSAYSITKRINSLNKTAVIIWGSYGRGFFGKFVNSFPGYSVELSEVDYECFNTMTTVKLINAIESKIVSEYLRNASIEYGLCFKKEDGSTFIGNTTLEKEIYNPDYSLVNMEKYIDRTAVEVTDDRVMRRVAPIITGDGCPFKCTFCINSSSETPYIPAKIDNITDTIDMLVREYKVDLIWFQDDNFFANKKNYKAVFEHIEKNGYDFEWAAQGMVNYFTEDTMSNKDFTRIMKNCKWLGVGFENFNHEVRIQLGKTKATNKDLWELINKAKDKNFELAIAFIVGTPKETVKDILQTAKFIFDIKRFYPKFSITYQYFRPYPKTKEFDDIQKQYSSFRLPKTLQEYIEQDPYGGKILSMPWNSISKNLVIKFTRFSVATLYKEYISKGHKIIFWRVLSHTNELLLKIISKVI